MSKLNALAGLIGNYGDSDEDSDDGGSKASSASRKADVPVQGFPIPDSHSAAHSSAAIHPAPIPHCPWSACYDESSGFTYYWNQQTNAVTWEAPPEYLLALKLAQQQLHQSGSTEVSAEEWQLYQLALAEKQNTGSKPVPKPAPLKPAKVSNTVQKNSKASNKRRISDEDEKIELITSYHNSDSDSNDETESPIKGSVAVKPPKLPKIQQKKPKTVKSKEYGPTLPPNQNYTMPIGPEIPPEYMVETPKFVSDKSLPTVPEEKKKPKPPENEDSQDEKLLLSKLKDKARLLEKLGGEIPVELKKIIRDSSNSMPNSPIVPESTTKSSNCDLDIDDLLQEIEKKELPKVVKRSKIDMFSEEAKSNEDSIHNSPRSNGFATPPSDEPRPLFPSSRNIADVPTASLFPSVSSMKETEVEKVKENPIVTEKKGANLYLADASEVLEKTSRKKLRISNSVLPVKKPELPTYTTKYAQAVDGFSGERTGLGFSKDDGEESAPKNTISYGNGLMFTKGETLNEDNQDEDLDDLTELLELKLKYLSQLQPQTVAPVQEMLIQMQVLAAPPAPPPPPPRTPPPPVWADPPPPGCDDLTPPLPPEPKQEIGDELTSFYNDIAEIEKHTSTSAPHTAGNSPESPLPPDLPPLPSRARSREKEREREREKEKEGKVKKKSKVKISSSMGMKQKSVSSLVAKWQQVADEINSD